MRGGWQEVIFLILKLWAQAQGRRAWRESKGAWLREAQGLGQAPPLGLLLAPGETCQG